MDSSRLTGTDAVDDCEVVWAVLVSGCSGAIGGGDVAVDVV